MSGSEVYRKLNSSPISSIILYYTEKILKEKAVQLGSVIKEMQTGKTPPKTIVKYYNKHDISWVKPSDIGYSKFLIEAKDKLSSIAVQEGKATLYEPNTLLMVGIGGGIGRVTILSNEGSSNQQITGIKLKEEVDVEYAYYYYLCREKYIKSQAKSSSFPILNQQRIEKLEFKYPEICRQKLFVKFIDHCCESLQNGAFPNLGAFKVECELIEFASTIFKIFYKKEELYHNILKLQTNTTQLRNTILHDAIKGRLVPQDLNDEPASELLKRIKKEKEKQVREGKLKKEKPLPPIKDEDVPFELPKGWVWCRLGELVSMLGDGLHGTPKYSTDSDYFFVNGNNLIKGKVEIKGNTKRVPYSEYLRHKKQMNNSTVLVSINGTLGNIAFFNEEKIILGKSACYINLLDGVNKYYIGLLIKSQYFLKWAVDVASETTIKNVSLKSMRNLPIPLPPFSEQNLIVEKANYFDQLASSLESGIINNQKKAELLMQAVLQEAFD